MVHHHEVLDGVWRWGLDDSEMFPLQAGSDWILEVTVVYFEYAELTSYVTSKTVTYDRMLS